MGEPRHTLSPAQFEKLRKIIYDRAGIWFADSKRYLLEARLSRRLAELNMDDFDQYATFLSIGPYRDAELNEMFSRITINETSFFRNEPQLSVFEKVIVPQLLTARNGMKQLRIWSSACSTGEEPYTLAILLHRSLGLRLQEWTIQIVGSDISDRALHAAKTGRYPSLSLRTTPPNVVQRYFRAASGFYQIDPKIQSMVSFTKVNLKDSLGARRLGSWDVIFCRNVLIYFDQPMRDNVIKLFHDTLTPDGSLLLGHSESIRANDLFVARPEPQAFAYSKAGVKKEALRGAA